VATDDPSQSKLDFVVDDEVNIADTLGLILGAQGFAVRTFYDVRRRNAADGRIYSCHEIAGAVSPLPHPADLRQCVRLDEFSAWRYNGGANVEVLANPFTRRSSSINRGAA
jgi:hypothetical protein